MKSLIKISHHHLERLPLNSMQLSKDQFRYKWELFNTFNISYRKKNPFRCRSCDTKKWCNQNKYCKSSKFKSAWYSLQQCVFSSSGTVITTYMCLRLHMYTCTCSGLLSSWPLHIGLVHIHLAISSTQVVLATTCTCTYMYVCWFVLWKRSTK